MTRVVPSQVVATIDQLFPEARNNKSQARHTLGQAGELRGIVDLIGQIPQELLILPIDQYANLVVGLGTIEERLRTWASRDVIPTGPDHVGSYTLFLIRRALLNCPDEYPPPLTADLHFISDQGLRDSIRRDVGAASQALHNGEWKAATVLAGAAIEALLHWKLGEPPLTAADIINAGKAAKAKQTLKKLPPAELDRWGLEHFIAVAGELNAIKPATVAAATLERRMLS